MKKLLVSVLAIAGLVACTQETTLVQKGNAPMEFGDAFVENATRAIDPSITTATITGFDVWGFMDSPAGKVFEGEDVTRSEGNFTYVNTQYWAPGHVYYFAALAPMNSANWSLNTAEANLKGAGEISFTNVNGTEDLLYAATSVSTMDLPVGEAPVDKVKFQFNHMLSKVKFSFTNGFQNDNAFITVSNIRMEVPAEGTIDVAQDWWSTNQWVLGEGKTILDFGNMEAEKVPYSETTECQFERLTIPTDATQSYNVTFDVKLFMGDVEAYAATLTTVIEGAELKIGKAYNFHAIINAANIVPGEDAALQEIVFDVAEVKTWEDGNGYEGGVIETGLYEKQIRDILAAGGVVELSQDLVVTESLVVAAGKEAVINLNGYDIINATDSEELGEGDGIIVYGNLTINGEGTVQGKTRCVWARGNDNPTVTINGGNYVGAVGGSTCEVIYASGNGKINIYGGTFQAETQDNVSFAAPQYAVLNIHGNGATGCDIVVYGGSFKNFDPANNVSENPAKNFCAPGYFSTKIGDYYVVSDTQVVATAEEFAEALKADAENIAVKLAGDLDVAISSLGQQTGGSGEYKLGGENTKNITIDLNGKKLNITTTYWSALGAKNADAVFTIKNGIMTSTGNSATPWNAWDLRFSNCNYVFEDVVFEKAVALDNVAKSTVMTGVTISDTVNTDAYGLWITAEGQTVTLEDCVIDMTPATDGRGIKIDEQYVGAPAKVTLNVANTTFKTEEKAAILVKSKAGAEINVENIDIAGVAADTTNAVWVDEDAAAYADKVIVNGANCKVEGK